VKHLDFRLASLSSAPLYKLKPILDLPDAIKIKSVKLFPLLLSFLLF